MNKQECRLSSIWTMWVAVPAFALVAGLMRGWWAGLLLVAVGVVFQVTYVRVFPHVSSWLGYGSVDDVPVPAPAHEPAVVPRVTLYTAAGCPFCPIARRRLEQLQYRLGFELDEQDVTFRRQLLIEKGIRSVPAIEADGHLLVGNATSDTLARFLRGQRRHPAA